MVKATSKIGSIVSYASVDSTTGNLNVLLINKKEESQVLNLGISSDITNENPAEVWQYKGNSNTDKIATFGKVEPVNVSDNLIQELNLPSTSITVITLKQ